MISSVMRRYLMSICSEVMRHRSGHLEVHVAGEDLHRQAMSERNGESARPSLIRPNGDAETGLVDRQRRHPSAPAEVPRRLPSEEEPFDSVSLGDEAQR